MILAQSDLITPDSILPDSIPLETAILSIPPPPGQNINCNYYNPRWIEKSGEVRTLQPLETAGTNANFQFASSTCSMPPGSTASTTAGFTSGEIVSTTFLFLILMVLGFDLFLKMLYPKK